LGCKNESKEYSIWILHSSVDSASSGSPSMFSGVFTAAEIYGVGDHGSRNTTTVHVLGSLFEHDPKICLFH
jgi:hypothetical protein